MSGGNADAVVFPETEAQICEYLTKIYQLKKTVTIAGNHTGLVGGAIPMGGEVLATHFMNQVFPQKNEKVLEIIQGKDEPTNLPYQFYLKSTHENEILAVVPPGLRLGEFQKRIEEHSLFYPPDPTEWNAFLGATVSTNASGARTFKYGATRAYVQSLRTVLAHGSILHIERGKTFANSLNQFEIHLSTHEKIKVVLPNLLMPSTKHAAGYFIKPQMDFIDLWIGSEGTLGVITQIELKLIPKPIAVMSAIVFFPRTSDAIHFVEDIRNHSHETWENKDPYGLDIRAIEYFDRESLNLLRKNTLGIRIPQDSGSAIYFEQESVSTINRETLEEWMNPLFENRSLTDQERQNFQSHPFGKMILLLQEKGVLDDLELAFPGEEKAGRRLKEFRHALPVKVNEIIGKYKRESSVSHLHKVGTDTATPDPSLSDMISLFEEKLKRSGIKYVIFGHIGNNHLHANLLPKNETELKRAKEIYLELCLASVKMGGTVSAEHGIGKMKHSSLELLYGKNGLQKLASIKEAIDPYGILGRGNIFPMKI